MEWGHEYPTLLEIQETAGFTPEALAKRPSLDPALFPRLRMFFRIGRSRDFSNEGAPRPIKLSEILSYCELYHIYGVDHRDWIVRLVEQLDGVYMKAAGEKLETPVSSAGKAVTP